MTKTPNSPFFPPCVFVGRPDGWTDSYAQMAAERGWKLVRESVNLDGPYEIRIRALEDPRKVFHQRPYRGPILESYFPSDEEAVAFVFLEASKGSALSCTAVKLLEDAASPDLARLGDGIRAEIKNRPPVETSGTTSGGMSRRCRYCQREMKATAQAYRENPFCNVCLNTRTVIASAANPVIGWEDMGGGYVAPIYGPKPSLAEQDAAIAQQLVPTAEELKYDLRRTFVVPWEESTRAFLVANDLTPEQVSVVMSLVLQHRNQQDRFGYSRGYSRGWDAHEEHNKDCP